MREMKDSGVYWIGKIPVGWRTAEIKNYCKDVYAGGTPQSSNLDYWDGDISWIPSGSCHDCKIYSAPKTITQKGFENSSTKMIPAGTALLAMTGATCANTGYLTFDSCANQSVTAYVSKEDTYSLFVWYLLQAAREHILTFQTGGAQGGINVEDCKNFVVPFMGYGEQRKIADYLDAKCSKIDEIIFKQEQIIEKLKEYKLSVITETMTKGLNPNIDMRDSGIEWIGQIPAHWRIGKIKAVTTKIGSGKTPKGGAEVYSSSGVLFLRSQNIYDDGLSLIEPTYITEEIDEEMSNTRVNPGDVLLNITGGSIGRCCIFPNTIEKANVNQHVSIIRVVKSLCIPEYMHFYWNSEKGKIAINLYQTGGNREGMSGEAIGNTPIPLPPVSEQREIVKSINERVKNTVVQISRRTEIIGKLVEYKNSLIYEVVTGKKEV